ncbi:MAG: purine-binding chemotaxis protein CheW [Alphaproteobacteria bacterium]|nr:purine-binding chemotaxis protein CheW [Alphaproteobacteria bacterium]MBV8549012.1 purine-binding chemotaxis protein CheW [Alphaproteobacteria bacterium]
MAAAADLAGAVQFLTFRVDDAEYGVDIMSVREIKGWTAETRLPNTPDYMRGVINLRGSIIPIFDLRCRFDHGLTQAHAKNVVVILAVGHRNIGILVDAVSDIVTVESGAIKHTPQEASHGIKERFVDGLISFEERMIILLNIVQLFTADAEALSQHIAPETQQ